MIATGSASLSRGSRKALRPVAVPLELEHERLSVITLGACWLFGAAAVILARGANWRLEPVNSDLFSALPIGYWVCIVCGTLLGLTTIRLSRREGTVTAAVIAVVFLTAPAFLLGVYPAISGWDSFLHGSPAVSLVHGGGIPSTNPYASQYPGTATLLATLGALSGLDLLVIEVVVTVLVNVTLTMIFMGIAQRFVGLRAAAVAALGVLALTPTVATNDHYSQWLIAYVAMLAVGLVLFCVVRPNGHGAGLVGANVLGVILAGSVIVSHPFLPVVTIALLVALALWSWRTQPAESAVLRAFLLTVLVGSVAWMVFVATVYFDDGLRFFRFALFQTQDVVDSWVPLSLSQVFLRTDDFGRALIVVRTLGYLATGGAALAGLLRRNRRNVFMLLWVSGFLGGSVLVGFASEAPWIQRALYLIPPFLVLAAVIGLHDLVELSSLGASTRRIISGLGAMGAAVVVVVGVALWHPPTLLYSVHPGNVAFIIWPQEQAATAYAARVRGPQDVLGSDLQSEIVYSFADPNSRVWDHGLMMASDLESRMVEQPLLFDGTLVLRSERQDIAAYQSADTGPAIFEQLDANLDASADRVYDNGFSQLYRVRKGDQ